MCTFFYWYFINKDECKIQLLSHTQINTHAIINIKFPCI